MRSLTKLTVVAALIAAACSPAARQRTASVIGGAAAGAGGGAASQYSPKIMVFGGVDHRTYLSAASVALNTPPTPS